MSNLFKAEIAKREKVKLMVGVTGPSGSGKTYSSLMLAFGLTGDWSKIALVCTENKSALYYAGEKTGDWKFINFSADTPNGYHPSNWVKLIDYAETLGVEVLVLDSISHEWEGAGGCLELVDQGKGFSAWKNVTPLHRRFIDKMRESKLHIIATMRSKSDYVVEQNDKGKAAPKKVGLKSTQRDGTDYEFGIIFDINIDHFATASKDRTGIFSDMGPFKITHQTGKDLLAWSSSGNDPKPVTIEIPATVDQPIKTAVVYDASASQKTTLSDIFKEKNVTDVEIKKKVSNALVNWRVPFDQTFMNEGVTEALRQLSETGNIGEIPF